MLCLNHKFKLIVQTTTQSDSGRPGVEYVTVRSPFNHNGLVHFVIFGLRVLIIDRDK